ncbi:MAG: DUF4832 domain-containing protein, partial [Candidatus Poribacteria bacterium]|nr:DUF4832 domain-containing protein [Candidatus Poribacteria bacterium]
YDEYADVVNALLDALPGDRFVQMRTPNYKRLVVGSATPISAEEAFGESKSARLGHHNDCFLATENDMGTYSGNRDRVYLEQDSQFAPVGGETCRPFPPHSDCENALREMSLYHWSYLNWDYHKDVLNSWRGECMDEVQRRLGYRFELVSGEFSEEVEVGGDLEVALTVQNVGFAAPYNPRDAEIVLRGTTTGVERAFALDVDPRRWLAGASHTLTHRIALGDVPSGDYELFLNLPDPKPTLRSNPDYAIRLANQGVWDSETGYNRLLSTVRVR